MRECAVGVDVGTQGVRVVVVGTDGSVVAEASRAFGPDCEVHLPPPMSEQRPEAWWTATAECLRQALSATPAAAVAAVSVDSTSGTFLPIDRAGTPLRPAIMYNDGRADEDLTAEVQDAGAELQRKLGYRFPPTFSLPKMVWLVRNEPEVVARAWKLVHAADWIVGKLCGRFDVTDISNCLKSGIDLVDVRWPSFIEDRLGVPLGKLPDVVMPGEPLGRVTATASRETGLAEGTGIVAGASDGTASFIASGACAPGDWNSTLGTTLAMRGVSEGLLTDPLGRYYSHRHPDGHWLPGGASNVGGECLALLFAGRDLPELDRAAEALLPTRLVVYPLVRRGERAPFVSSSAEGFVLGQPSSEEELYAAYLEGVALVERWCYDSLRDLGARVVGPVRATGGGSASDVWLRIRASALETPLIVPRVSGAAMGAAILAASRTLFGGLAEAGASMVRVARSVEPDRRLAPSLADRTAKLKAECAARGYRA